jgi:hypothetical protein
MKKFAKMSLVAAVAVAGLSSTVAAKPLADAIQGTSVSGLVRYRVNDKKQDGKRDTNSEQAKLVFGIKSKVNDKVTAALKWVGVLTQKNSVTTGAPALGVAKFTYANDGLTATAGLMELATPWTDAGDGARANGILATKALGKVTVAAACFRDSIQGGDKTVSINSNNLKALAVIGAASGISYQAWYLDIGKAVAGDTGSALQQGGTATALVLKGKAGIANINASYATLEGDSNTLDTQSLMKVVATAPVNNIKLTVGLASGGSDGDLVTFDQDAAVGFESAYIRAGGANQFDLSAYTVAAAVPVKDVTLSLQYTNASYDATKGAAQEDEVSEICFKAAYKMSKNFSTYLRVANLSYDKALKANDDTLKTRIQLLYKF